MGAQAPRPGLQGVELLAAHCNSLDPRAPTARERLDDLIGSDLARVLVFALVATGETRLRVAV